MTGTRAAAGVTIEVQRRMFARMEAANALALDLDLTEDDRVALVLLIRRGIAIHERWTTAHRARDWQTVAHLTRQQNEVSAQRDRFARMVLARSRPARGQST